MAVVRAPIPAEQPVGVLVSRAGTDVARIIRAEIALAQLRVTMALRDAGTALVVSALLGMSGTTENNHCGEQPRHDPGIQRH